MTAEALAIVFSPNLLRAPQNNFAMILNNMGLSHKLVKAFITHVSPFSLGSPFLSTNFSSLLRSSTSSSMNPIPKSKFIQMTSTNLLSWKKMKMRKMRTTTPTTIKKGYKTTRLRWIHCLQLSTRATISTSNRHSHRKDSFRYLLFASIHLPHTPWS